MSFFIIRFSILGSLWLFRAGNTQDVSGLPACGQYCVQTISAQAVANANCNVNHANCYCSRYDFVNKVKTCAQTQCTSAADQTAVNSYAAGYCADAGSGPGGGNGRPPPPPPPPPGSNYTYPPPPPPYPPPSTSLTTSQAPSQSTSIIVIITSAAAKVPHSSPSSTPPSSGLSTGTKAAIGIAAPLGAIAIAAVAVALLWRRKKNRRGMEVIHEADTYEKPIEMDVPRRSDARGLDARELDIKEADGVPRPVYEMPVDSGRHEAG